MILSGWYQSRRMFQGKGPNLDDPKPWGSTGIQKDERDTKKSHIPWFIIMPGVFHVSLHTCIHKHAVL